jgi:hypothetical protein
MLHGLAVLAAIGLIFCLGGCNTGPITLPETGATLEGTVTYGGEKVLVAMVIAAPTDGKPGAQGVIGEDGRYKIENCPLGEVNLAVNVKAGEGMLRGRQMAGGKIPKIVSVPDKYGEPKTAGITTTVNKGENVYNIEIKK